MKGEKDDGRRALSNVARLIAAGNLGPRVFRLVTRRIEVGKAAGSDLRIVDDSVSERHARIRRWFGRYRLKDLGSAHGTFVNGRRIKGSVTIQPGDEVRFGAARFALVRGPGEGASAAGAPALSMIALTVLFGALGYLSVRFVQAWNEMDAAPAATPSVASHAEALSKPTPTTPAPVPSTHRPRAVVRAHPDGARAEAVPAAKRTILRTSGEAPAAARAPRAPAKAPLPAAVSTAVAAPSDHWPKPDDWLGWVNWYRRQAGLEPVVEDAKLSAGDANHARYIVKNYFTGPNPTRPVGIAMHQESPGNAWYTPEGAKAAVSSDVGEFTSMGLAVRKDWLPSWAVNEWVGIPFHRLPILNPALRRVGYGEDCASNGSCAYALDVEQGRDPMPMGKLYPNAIEFPAPDSTLYMSSLANEWPDPLAACPGYARPAGVPITIQLGSFVKPKLMTYSLTRDGQPLEVCGFDANSYANPDATSQKAGRDSLYGYGAVVIVPRKPLVPGATYQVSATVDGRNYAWSFHVGKAPTYPAAR